MLRSYHHGHSLGAGLVVGLVVAQRPLWIFAAGVGVGVALVFAVRALRRIVGAVRFGGRLLERVAGRPAEAPSSGSREAARLIENGSHSAGQTPSLPPATLTELEREQERRVGLRQGEAAGVRAAARIEARERARREAMVEASARFGRELSRQSLARALESR